MTTDAYYCIGQSLFSKFLLLCTHRVSIHTSSLGLWESHLGLRSQPQSVTSLLSLLSHSLPASLPSVLCLPRVDCLITTFTLS